MKFSATWSGRLPRYFVCAAVLIAVLTGSSSLAFGDISELQDAVAQRLELVELLKAEKFAELQARVASPNVKIVDGASALQAFSRVDPGIAGPLARWRDAYPKSFAPHLAFGLYSSAVGGAMRGEQFSHLTHKKRFEEMHTYFNAAEDALRTALQINPKLETAWISLINLTKVQGRKIEMMSYLNEAIAALPNHSGVYWTYFKAIEPKWGGSAKQRLALKIRIMANYPNDPDFAWLDSEEDFEEAWKLYYTERYAAALEKFKDLVADRDTGARRKGIAWSLVSMGKVEEGIAEMEKALSMRPTDANIYADLAGLQFSMPEMRQTARRNQDIAVALHPYDPKYLVERARFLIADGKIVLAKRDLDNALFFGAYDDAVHDGLRKYYLTVDDADAALEEAEKMVALVPGNPRNYMLYGVTLYWSEDCRAGQVLKQFLEACRGSKTCTKRDKEEAKTILQTLGFSCG